MSLLPRRSAESACLFCRQGLARQMRTQYSHPSRQFSIAALTATTSVSAASSQPWLARPQQQQRRRFLSGTAPAHMPPPPPYAQPVERSSESTAPAASASASAASTKSTSSSSSSAAKPYTRYSLYPAGDSPSPAPMTMRPPPPPEPVVPIESDQVTAKKAATHTQTTQKASASTAQSNTTESLQKTSASPVANPTKPTATSPTPAASTASTATAAAAPAAAPKKRPSKLRAPRKAAMKLTPAAVEQVRELLEGPEPKLIKVGVKNRGCSGLAYNLEYVEKPGAFDELVEQDGVRVLVDSKALFSIIGSEMDWVEDKLNQRFVFRNPNIKEQCGCGESFMV